MAEPPEIYLDTPRSIYASAGGFSVRLQKDVDPRSEAASYTVTSIVPKKPPHRMMNMTAQAAMERFVKLYRKYFLGG